MAQWGDAKIFFCILFITCCCAGTMAQLPLDCCLSVKNQTIGKHAIVDYRHQIAGQGCPLDATILVTRRNLKLCVPVNQRWVERILEHVRSLREICKKNKYRGRRCVGISSK